MKRPLRDPILEAAAQILHAKGDVQHNHIHFCRLWAADNRPEAVRLVETAARQVYQLRAWGAVPAAMAEWKPIASAPTDREIIVANHENARTATHMTAIEDGSTEWVIARWNGAAVVFGRPTHWMERPPLPAGEGVDDE